MEGMQELITHIASQGINIAASQIVLTIMANIDNASSEEFGREFQPALQNIRAKYNHKHDGASFKVILLELAKVDLVRTLEDATAPGTTNKVTSMPEKNGNEQWQQVWKQQQNREGSIKEWRLDSGNKKVPT